VADDTLTVRVDSIGPRGVDIERDVSSAWVDSALGEGSPFAAGGGGHLELHLERVRSAHAPGVVHVRGRGRLALSATCSRCLGPVALALDTPIEVAMFPAGHEPPAAPDGELQAEDMGIATYTQDEIDLARVVHDEVFLQLPMNPLCSESCAGLCASCGASLNEGPCGCEPPAESRWSAFSDVKLS